MHYTNNGSQPMVTRTVFMVAELHISCDIQSKDLEKRYVSLLCHSQKEYVNKKYLYICFGNSFK